MNALTPTQIEDKLLSTPEEQTLHPEQQKVIALLEKYPADKFVMYPYFSPGDSNPLFTTTDEEPSTVCFTCVAGWTCSEKSGDGAVREAGRLNRIAGLTSDRAHERMHELVARTHGTLSKAEVIKRVTDIFMDREQ